MNVIPFPSQKQVLFDRKEIDRIMQLYGRMVTAGEWRDYAMDFGKDMATFSAFRRNSERPEFQLIKIPALRHKQGQYILKGEAGQILKRGDELESVMAPALRRLMKAID